MSDLSILCVTRGEECVIPLLQTMVQSACDLDCELVIAADGVIAADRLQRVSDFRHHPCQVVVVESSGYIESVLDAALDYMDFDSPNNNDKYILRLDDDEQINEGMHAWLADGGYRSSPHWKFPRAHAWGEGWHDYSKESHELSCIINPPLWPDHQTRLSHRSMSGGRTILHCGSPYGGGEVAPCLIEHWKFVIKTLPQRRDIVERYNRIQSGMGDGFRVFSTPEDVIAPEDIQLISLADLEHSLKSEPSHA